MKMSCYANLVGSKDLCVIKLKHSDRLNLNLYFTIHYGVLVLLPSH